MKHFNLIISSFALIAVLLVSCSENESNSPIVPSQTDYSQYFPMTIGSWWIIENYTLDDEMNRTEMTSKDSLVVVGEESLAGKTASIFISYDLASGFPTDTSYYYIDGSIIYEYTTLTPFDGGKDWLPTYDFALNSKFTVLDTNVTNADMGDGSLFTGNVKATINKGTDKTLEVKGKSFQTKAFDLSMVLSGTINAGLEVAMNMAMDGNIYFAKGIGNVQTLSKATIDVGPQSIKMNSEEIVVDYSIK